MKVMRVIGWLVAILLLVGVVLHFTGKGPYSYTETANIKGSPDAVWSNISDMKKFAYWNPWYKMDTAVALTFEGNAGEVGNSYGWDSKVKDMGTGRMVITAVEPMKKVTCDLQFIKPFEDVSKTMFAMEPNSDGTTKVSWTMDGEMDFPMSIMGKLMGMEKMLRSQFQEGLANLQKAVDNTSLGGGSTSGGLYKVEEKNFAPTTYVTLRKEVAFKDIATFLGSNYQLMGEAMGKAKVQPLGYPVSIYYNYDMEKQIADMAAAMPVAAGTKLEGFTMVDVPATPYYHLDYFGAYTAMMPAYNALDAYAKSKGKEPNPYMVIEQYVSDPMVEKDTAKWHTAIHYFLK